MIQHIEQSGEIGKCVCRTRGAGAWPCGLSSPPPWPEWHCRRARVCLCLSNGSLWLSAGDLSAAQGAEGVSTTSGTWIALVGHCPLHHFIMHQFLVQHHQFDACHETGVFFGSDFSLCMLCLACPISALCLACSTSALCLACSYTAQHSKKCITA